jgi:AcrR family transcriptional regulator/transcription elongation factor Elf1
MSESSYLSRAKSLRREPKQQRGRERVAKILLAAAEVFAEVGYATATIQQIADRSATAIGSIYQFFPDKLAIFHALEAEHMQQVDAVNVRLLSKDLRRPLAELISDMVDVHSAYFEHPIPQIVYLQYFLAPVPGLFALFDADYDRALIEQFADLCQYRNPALSRAKSLLIGEIFHRTYNGTILAALKSDRSHRQELYAELKILLCAYLDPYLGDKLVPHIQVMTCPECQSEKLAKNGHRHGKQRYICKNCGRQFGIEPSERGYPSEIVQKCLELHAQGVSFREIERQTGVSHNTVINWARAAK